ncbi:two-component system, OmpR family, response regulator QseB/two-component system, OmpR family, response regulator TctD [Phyllobacterium sp. YR620]|uniref:response regulator transcription factor n=1 Tax=Phyllobacterium sp. YR620 TaxID=1881066 RepID=UPI000883FA7B|nr:response regulator transcription factor [Phyllobacterium sp. YR620]SDP54624.1 two-component system, OmpR family, response regulator QseB/two-component system, OmpR family, response regulator TctD [Phyllobacterium sp. YR620]
MRVLLIEDSVRLCQLISEILRDANWQVDAFATGEDARHAMSGAEYDIVLLDLGLPDEDGLETLGSLRRLGHQIPVLILTARSTIDERIVGLDAGADDYLAKPFNNGELLARMRALLRRPPQSMMPELAFGKLTLNLATSLVNCGSEPISLAPRECAVLEHLMRNAGRVLPKRKLESAFSEFGDERTSNAVELAISRLRKKLEYFDTALVVETIRGVGYMLRESNP